MPWADSLVLRKKSVSQLYISCVMWSGTAMPWDPHIRTAWKYPHIHTYQGISHILNPYGAINIMNMYTFSTTSEHFSSWVTLPLHRSFDQLLTCYPRLSFSTCNKPVVWIIISVKLFSFMTAIKSNLIINYN